MHDRFRTLRVLSLLTVVSLIQPVRSSPPADVRASSATSRTSEIHGRENGSATEGRTLPTAEELLRTLQRKRPSNEIIAPGSSRGAEVGGPALKLLPEGYPFVDRVGDFRRMGSQWTFNTRTGESVSLKVVPNAVLELAARTTQDAIDPVLFSVSGEMLVFERENYLLLRSAMRSSDEAIRGKADSGPPSSPTPSSKTEDGGAAQPSAEDVLARMKNLAPSNEIVTTAEPAQDAAANLSADRRQSLTGLLMDGSFIANRSWRPVRHGDDWLMVPESSRPDSTDLPLRLLPCQGLEFMKREVERGAHGLVYLVSGEVTLFENANYFLPRRVVRRADLGNLRP